MSESSQQRGWRRQQPGSITAHLSDEDIAVLDAIAISIWEEHPHDPELGLVSDVRPSRQAAVKWLIERYRQQHGQPKDVPERRQMGEFWKAETNWRRTEAAPGRKKAPSPPSPVW